MNLMLAGQLAKRLTAFNRLERNSVLVGCSESTTFFDP